MHVGHYLELLRASEQQLADALLAVAGQHGDEPDIEQTCRLLAAWSQDAGQVLAPLVTRYATEAPGEPERLHQALFRGVRRGNLALVRDLHDLYLLAQEVQLSAGVLSQAARALRDQELLAACESIGAQSKRQLDWLLTRIRQAAPQALVVAA
ncbi:MAG: molybdopterin oxidoreductase [Pseudomonadota bacterium]|uniref:hypothetical protein n=1 Tax=Thermithiobacillus tepidarius TaxID=929 RepID=UPI000420AC32|nr:hypothetical protein [Thermithiobacillus tepidarius]